MPALSVVDETSEQHGDRCRPGLANQFDHLWDHVLAVVVHHAALNINYDQSRWHTFFSSKPPLEGVPQPLNSAARNNCFLEQSNWRPLHPPSAEQEARLRLDLLLGFLRDCSNRSLIEQVTVVIKKQP